MRIRAAMLYVWMCQDRSAVSVQSLACQLMPQVPTVWIPAEGHAGLRSGTCT